MCHPASHFVDTAGWQAIMASIELWIQWCNAHGPHFVLRPSKELKLVRTDQFQVKSTKMGTGRKFVTLQYPWTKDVKLNFLLQFGAVCIRHSIWQKCHPVSHSVDRAGWQAKMASIELWIQWRYAHGQLTRPPFNILLMHLRIHTVSTRTHCGTHSACTRWPGSHSGNAHRRTHTHTRARTHTHTHMFNQRLEVGFGLAFPLTVTSSHGHASIIAFNICFNTISIKALY